MFDIRVKLGLLPPSPSSPSPCSPRHPCCWLQICQVYDSAECVRNIHPDAKWRQSATAACQVRAKVWTARREGGTCRTFLTTHNTARTGLHVGGLGDKIAGTAPRWLIAHTSQGNNTHLAGCRTPCISPPLFHHIRCRLVLKCAVFRSSSYSLFACLCAVAQRVPGRHQSPPGPVQQAAGGAGGLPPQLSSSNREAGHCSSYQQPPSASTAAAAARNFRTGANNSPSLLSTRF